MVLWERISRWADEWGWRRYAPAAGSVVAHGVVGVAIAALMASSVKPSPRKAEAPPLAIEVSLMADTLPMRPTAPRPQPKPSPSKTEPATERAPVGVPERKDQQAAALPEISTTAPSGGSDSVYLGPSPFAQPGTPGGLQGLAMADACSGKYGPKPKDCTNWKAKVGSMDSVMPRSKEELASLYGEFMPVCLYRVGCEEKGEWISTNGTRNVAGTRMAGGVESVGGITDTVGRLGFNPDHFDRGFGN